MEIKVTDEMLEAANNISEGLGLDESYWLHLAQATYDQMIEEGIIIPPYPDK